MISFPLTVTDVWYLSQSLSPVSCAASIVSAIILSPVATISLLVIFAFVNTGKLAVVIVEPEYNTAVSVLVTSFLTSILLVVGCETSLLLAVSCAVILTSYVVSAVTLANVHLNGWLPVSTLPIGTLTTYVKPEL